METNPLLNTPPDSKQEDHMVGSFLRQVGKRNLRDRYASKLATDHGIHQPPPDSGSGKARGRSARTYWYLAAAASILLCLGAFLLYPNQEDGFEELLAENLSVESYYLPMTRGESPAMSSRFETQLLLDYGAGKFEAVTARQGSRLSPVGTFYLALALIVTDRKEEALVQLRDIPMESDLREEADWFALLLRLEAGEIVEGRRLLAAYKPDNLIYYRRAQALLKSLRVEE